MTGPSGSDDLDTETGDTETDDLETMRALATELSFRADDDVLEESLEKASRLRDRLAVESLTPAEGEPRGHLSEDEHNALLYVYDTPRTETNGGPLAGLTFAIKDEIAVRDLQMTCGVKNLLYVPSYDATVTERLVNAGATIVGKANMYAFGVGKRSEFGRARNAVDDSRIPGGSSSGSGVAVGSGLVDASIGSDAGGSVRIPAAFNGVVGVKPTTGTVSSFGSVSTMQTLGTKGIITRTIEDAARTLDVIAGPDRRDPGTWGRELESTAEHLDEEPSCTIGLPDSLFDDSDPEVRDVITELVDDIREQTDCSVRRISFDNSMDHLPPYLSGPELAWLLRQGGVNHGGGTALDPTTHHFLQAIQHSDFNDIISRKKLPHAYLDAETEGMLYATAHRNVYEYRETVAAYFDDVDLLLTPTVPLLPPPVADDIDDEPSTSGNTRPFNLAGTPAITVPAGERNGLPVGAQIVAPAFEDARAFRGARMVERLRQ